MLLLLFLTATSADLDALNQSVERCDRATVNPAFSAESERRSQFLLEAYREQEAIVAARLDLAARRRLLRESSVRKSPSEESKLALEEAAIEDRQRALNDRRMLEGIRQDTTDAMRRYFLAHCAAGKDKK